MFNPTVDFYTSLSVAECKYRLGVLLKHNKRPNVRIAKGGVFGQWFYMFRQTYRRNSFRPFLVGKIEETPKGTRITGRFWVHPLVIAFMLFWYSLAEGLMPPPLDNRVVLILLLALLLVFGVILSWSQRDELQDYLKEQLSTSKPFSKQTNNISRKPDRSFQQPKVRRSSIDILVTQPISKSKQQLVENIDKAFWAGNNPVIGQVIGDWFYLYERPYHRISFLFYFYGRFKSVTRGTRITGRFWMNPFLTLFVFLSIGGVLIKLIADIIGYMTYYVDYGHWPLLFPRLLGLLWLLPIGGIVVFSWLLSLSSRNYLCEYAINVFESENSR